MRTTWASSPMAECWCERGALLTSGRTWSRCRWSFRKRSCPSARRLEVLHVPRWGRIHTLIIRGNATEVTNRLAVYAPILMDALPLTLEEIFIYEPGR